MPRTALTPAKTSRAHSAGGVTTNVVMTEAAFDNANGNSFTNTGREFIVARNPTGGGLTITLKAADGTTSVGSAITVAAGKSIMIGPFNVYHYGSTLNFDTSSASLVGFVAQLDTKSVLGGQAL